MSQGWLARLFEQHPVPTSFAAPGMAVGNQMFGPLAGSRSIAVAEVERFTRQAQLATPAKARGPAALRHVMAVESDVVHAASKLPGGTTGNAAAAPVVSTSSASAFPAGPFGNALRMASDIIASKSVAAAGAAVYKVTLDGFDTHQNQPGVQANLLRQLGEGLAAFQIGRAHV